MPFKNFAYGIVVTAPSPATSGTSLVLDSGEGATFPATADGEFYVTACPPGTDPTIGNAEILKVTTRSTDTFTIVRAQRDTTSKSIAAGWRVFQGVYVEDQPSITSILASVYPVGSVYIAVVSTSPATLFGFGTWAAFGAGRTLVGLDAGQTEFDTVEETGGAKTHTLQTTEIPSHTHQQLMGNGSGAITTAQIIASLASFGVNVTQATGGGGAHNNLQPYIVTYMWKRTA